jgi:predicted DNA-binding transcriptional regulator YafY
LRECTGSTQELKELSDRGVELSLHLSDVEEIERWVLSWGAHATVLAPAELVARLHVTIDRLSQPLSRST